MNHHADKIVHESGDALEQPNAPLTASSRDRVVSRQGLGIDGVLEEFHTCPACGAAASRVISAAK